MKLIRILHHLFQDIEYIYLCEFFKLCGVYVQEYIIEEEIAILKFRDYSCSIYVMGEDEEESEIPDDYVPFPAFPGGMLPDKRTRESYVNRTIRQILQLGEGDNLLIKLYRIYDRYNLMYCNYDLRYFYKSIKGDLTGFLTKYTKAVEEVLELPMNRNSSFALFFRVNCARKANEIRNFLGMVRVYSSKEMIFDLLEYAKEHPECRNAYVLAGVIAERDAEISGNAILYYSKGLESDWDYDSDIYYRMGRFYEKNRKNYPQALEYYKSSRSVDPTNYRAAYKEAFLNELKKNYDYSFDIYLKIGEQLEQKRKKNYIQPIEMEYLLKCYVRMNRILRITQNRLFAARKIMGMVGDPVKDLKEDLFIKCFYKNKADRAKRIDATCARLPLPLFAEEISALNKLLRKYDYSEV